VLGKKIIDIKTDVWNITIKIIYKTVYAKMFLLNNPTYKYPDIEKVTVGMIYEKLPKNKNVEIAACLAKIRCQTLNASNQQSRITTSYSKKQKLDTEITTYQTFPTNKDDYDDDGYA